MKNFFIITFLSFFVTIAKADCLGYRTKCIWPCGKLISNNSIVIINTGDSSYGNAIGSKYKIYLQSTKTKNRILLLVTQVCNGGLNVMQIILTPSSKLIEDEEYELIAVDRSKKITKFTGRDFEQQKDVAIKWKAVNRSGNAPVWQKQPTLIRKIYIGYGCGPEVKTIFSFEPIEPSKQLIKTIVKNKRTGIEKTCYLPSSNGLFELGHNMCWGEFEFVKKGENDNDEYEVRFNLVDESGNISIQSDVISFIQPNGANE